MKRTALTILGVMLIFLCSCTADTSGYSNELRTSRWSATLEGGARVSLAFSDGNALLSIKNGEESAVIKGSCVVDEHSFVIFVPEISKNYGFEYVPKGGTLDLTYNSHTITLEKEKSPNR